MRFFGIPAVGIMSGIAFGFCGLWPLLGPAIPSDSSSQQIVTQKPVIPTFDFTESESDQAGAPKSTAELALSQKVERLKRGVEFLQGVDDYRVKMQKQEVVRGELLDEQTISIKCRHKPFSVYLLWLSGNVGREVIYIDGQNNGNMIAHDGGWKARIPAFTLSIDGMMAMRDARYPVTTAGILGLIDIMLGVHQQDLNCSNVASCEIHTAQSFDGRSCDMFTTRYKSAKDSPIYRKSITLIDNEWNVPLYSRHFEWPKVGNALTENELDEATLIEAYTFTELELRCNLTDHDFDRTNSEYRFH